MTTDDTRPLSAKSLSNAYYSECRTHGAHTHDGPLHEPCREYVMGECVLATLDAERARHATLLAALDFIADWAHDCRDTGVNDSTFYGFDLIETKARAALASEEAG